jgi:hypothetical protein
MFFSDELHVSDYERGFDYIADLISFETRMPYLLRSADGPLGAGSTFMLKQDSWLEVGFA